MVTASSVMPSPPMIIQHHKSKVHVQHQTNTSPATGKLFACQRPVSEKLQEIHAKIRL